MAAVTICSDFGAQNEWEYLNNSLSLLLKMFGLKKSGELVQGAFRFIVTGWQTSSLPHVGSLLASFPRCEEDTAVGARGSGVWRPNLGWLPGRESLWQLGFSLAFSGSVGAPHRAVFPLNELREWRATKGFPWARAMSPGRRMLASAGTST